MNKFIDTLKQAKLTEQDIALFQRIAIPQNIKTHKILVDYGEICTDVYFILRGGFVMQVLKEEDGSERTFNFFLDNFEPFMGIPQNFFNGTPSSCKLTAIRNSNILVFPKKELLELIESNSCIKEFYQQQIIRALLIELNFRIKLLSLSPLEFYKLLISDYQPIIQNVSSRHIANFIGISPEWLSNLKKNL